MTASASVLVALACLVLPSLGCAHRPVIPGTEIADNEENRAVLQVLELYRQRLMERNVEGLLVLASEKYFEDSGTPSADDDYDYKGLKSVLATRLTRLKSLRYDIQYRSLNIEGNRAEVEVFMSGAFELVAESGDRYRRVSDYHRFVLERTDRNDKWKFVRGM
jgi:hypothetical protein